MAGGFEHSVALGQDGEMYSFGCNNHGQLALGSKSNAYAPTRVQWPRPPHGPNREQNVGKSQSFSIFQLVCGYLFVRSRKTVWVFSILALQITHGVILFRAPIA